ncbi:hypothetical protein RclHR1_09010001 [Rhizophagus clarus]|uniref:Uncharacterized protein n=1 Tax=Rhizophagus clarus TaxID=94130 RepID=A0A2Z6S2M9_9GLOM|nr:hypothetical protein RclHR1_09010001 [Rhizophagus clarus]GES73937.1 hypothetical protein GLOIN_2v461630 [Rhizophagus clarus]
MVQQPLQNNKVRDNDGDRDGVNNEIGSPIIKVTYTKPVTLTAPFNPFRPFNYSKRDVCEVKFPIMEPDPLNNFLTSFDEAIKLGLSQRDGADFNTTVEVVQVFHFLSAVFT